MGVDWARVQQQHLLRLRYFPRPAGLSRKFVICCQWIFEDSRVSRRAPLGSGAPFQAVHLYQSPKVGAECET